MVTILDAVGQMILHIRLRMPNQQSCPFRSFPFLPSPPGSPNNHPALQILTKANPSSATPKTSETTQNRNAISVISFTRHLFGVQTTTRHFKKIQTKPKQNKPERFPAALQQHKLGKNSSHKYPKQSSRHFLGFQTTSPHSKSKPNQINQIESNQARAVFRSSATP
jgi:hypothetical protein